MKLRTIQAKFANQASTSDSDDEVSAADQNVTGNNQQMDKNPKLRGHRMNLMNSWPEIQLVLPESAEKSKNDDSENQKDNEEIESSDEEYQEPDEHIQKYDKDNSL
ncbi:hypothetical protein GW7_04245 [Heterocephalus glaber]|uniref:Uncharacterized protein n=1 Tax=Heterocephalus glaber TaxID=10181 RepID=G5AV63_HETGA|nr:hypothetical protein GW7_04245 [Heterocephalus glaber]